MVSLNVLVLAAAITAGGDDVMLLDFSADWCGPCKLMGPTMQRLEQDRFPVRRIDIDQYPRLVEQWKVGPIPCYILIRNGREVERVVGAASYDRLARMFERAGYAPAARPDERLENARPTRQSSPHASVADPSPRGQSPPRTESRDSRGLDSRGATTIRGQSPEPSLAQRLVEATASVTPGLGARGPMAPVEAPASERTLERSPERPSPDVLESQAAEATVRLRLEESNGNSFGTGTIVDVHGDEALVLTCGHLFRESSGRGPIHVDLLVPGAPGPVVGQLIAYEADELDIALVSIRPGIPVRAARVAPTIDGIQPGAAVFSMGCDHGGPLSVMRGQITSIDRYVGRHASSQNIEVSGAPVDGRSGGGLFNARGELIGICNAADPEENEGIYAGLKTVHWQLAQIGQARIFEQGALTSLPPADTAPDTAPNVDSNLLTALNSGADVICVIRTPGQGDELLVLDAASRSLLADFARARASRELRSTE